MNRDYTKALNELSSLLDEDFTMDVSVLEEFTRDKSALKGLPPLAVCRVQEEKELSEILKICTSHRLPLIASGARTSLEGHSLHTVPGISVDMSRMNRIIDLSPGDRHVLVQAGIRKSDLNTILAEEGLWYAAGPGINASIGGMLACGASGANAVMYGTVKENIRSVRFLDGRGRSVQSRRNVVKSAAGYDLTQLIVGSEGTLGIITEACICLHKLPVERKTMVIAFSCLSDALACGMELLSRGMPLAMIEILNKLTLLAMNSYSASNYSGEAALFIELHLRDEKDPYTARIEEISGKFNRVSIEAGHTPEQREELLKRRYDLYYAIQAYWPERSFITTDVTVPVSRLFETICETELLMEKNLRPSPILGHIGDGNFHGVLGYDKSNTEEKEKCQTLNHQIVQLALSRGGTCTGEHGIGISKRQFLSEEFDPVALDLMKKIKDQFDPLGILNPGKIFL